MLRRLVRVSLTRRFSAEAALESKPAASKMEATTDGAANSGGGGDTLGRRLLSLVYQKRSAVIAIRKWKEEGRVVRKYDFNRVVRELRKLKRYKHALEVCEWMRIQKDMKLLPGDYALHLDLIAKVRGMNNAEKFFEDLPENMRDHTTCTALLHNYVQHKEAAKAEALMEKMSECGFLKSPLPYNHLISLYISMGKLEKVAGVLDDMKKTTSPDLVTYNMGLTVCAAQNDVESAEKILLELKKDNIDPDWVTYSILSNIYIKNSVKDKATLTLKEMEKRISKKVRVAYSSLISLHAQVENKADVFGIWRKMKLIYRKLRDSEYSCMISSVLKLKEIGEAEKLYIEWESVSMSRDTRISNLLLAAYINNDQIEKTDSFLNRMIEKSIPPSYTTWELFTWGYLKEEKVDKVLDCFKKMVGTVKKWNPDEKIVSKVFEILEKSGDIEKAEEFLATLKKAGHVNTEIYNSLLRTYAKAGKMPLIIAERMKIDNVQLDDETRRLIGLTSKMCVAEVPNFLS